MGRNPENGYNQAQRTPLPREKDRRVKLSDADRMKIKEFYAAGFPIREIARKFEHKCTRRTIQFVLFPDRLKTVNYPGHWKKYKVSKEEWARTMREHRRHKLKVFQETQGMK